MTTDPVFPIDEVPVYEVVVDLTSRGVLLDLGGITGSPWRWIYVPTLEPGWVNREWMDTATMVRHQDPVAQACAEVAQAVDAHQEALR